MAKADTRSNYGQIIDYFFMGLSRDRGLNGMTIVIYNEMTILTMFPLRPKNYYLLKKKNIYILCVNKIKYLIILRK